MNNILILHFYRKNRGGEDIVIDEIINIYKKSNYFNVFQIKYYYAKYKVLWDLINYYLGFFRLVYIIAFVIKNKIKFIHTSNYFPLLNLFAINFLTFFGINVIIHYHNHKISCPIGTHWNGCENCFKCNAQTSDFIYSEKCSKNYLNRLLYQINHRIDLKALKKINHNPRITIVVLTNWYQNHVKTNFFLETKVLRNMLSENISKYRTFEIEDYSLFLGRDEITKGYDSFLKLVRHFKNTNFIAIGPNRNLNYKNLKELGWLSRDETLKYISKGKCLISPNIGLETFGMNIYESLLLGIPVITSPIYSNVELFKKFPNVYIYNNFEELKNIFELNIKNNPIIPKSEYQNYFDEYFKESRYENKLLELWKIK